MQFLAKHGEGHVAAVLHRLLLVIGLVAPAAHPVLILNHGSHLVTLSDDGPGETVVALLLGVYHLQVPLVLVTTCMMDLPLPQYGK